MSRDLSHASTIMVLIDWSHILLKADILTLFITYSWINCKWLLHSKMLDIETIKGRLILFLCLRLHKTDRTRLLNAWIPRLLGIPYLCELLHYRFVDLTLADIPINKFWLEQIIIHSLIDVGLVPHEGLLLDLIKVHWPSHVFFVVKGGQVSPSRLIVQFRLEWTLEAILRCIVEEVRWRS